MISRETIAEMAELFDRFMNALDPDGPEAQKAEELFHEKASALHAVHGPDLGFAIFRYELMSECRKYLAKN